MCLESEKSLYYRDRERIIAEKSLKTITGFSSERFLVCQSGQDFIYRSARAVILRSHLQAVRHKAAVAMLAVAIRPAVAWRVSFGGLYSAYEFVFLHFSRCYSPCHCLLLYLAEFHWPLFNLCGKHSLFLSIFQVPASLVVLVSFLLHFIFFPAGICRQAVVYLSHNLRIAVQKNCPKNSFLSVFSAGFVLIFFNFCKNLRFFGSFSGGFCTLYVIVVLFQRILSGYRHSCLLWNPATDFC